MYSNLANTSQCVLVIELNATLITNQWETLCTTTITTTNMRYHSPCTNVLANVQNRYKYGNGKMDGGTNASFYRYIANVTSGGTMKENPMKYCSNKAATFKR